MPLHRTPTNPNKPTTLAALLIKPGGPIERITIERSGDDGAHAVHALVGNWFTSCFTVPGNGGRRVLMGYCDDEGLLRDRAVVPWNAVLDTTLRQAPEAICGPIVVMAHSGPDSTTMSELEMSAFHVGPDFVMRGLGAARLRSLTFRPGYDL
jgi:hypothetical protein